MGSICPGLLRPGLIRDVTHTWESPSSPSRPVSPETKSNLPLVLPRARHLVLIRIIPVSGGRVNETSLKCVESEQNLPGVELRGKRVWIVCLLKKGITLSISFN